jgi:hypothetical protein
MIGLYKGHVFQGNNRMWTSHIVKHLGEWDGSDEVFLTTYHLKFPNEKLQIYLHKYKPLSRQFKSNIETFMENDPYFIQIKRQEILNNLLS